ncbi:dynein regulatory complex subunit 2-like isoform X2 [Metopolophium dirhodum]|uniref:dynein regulatory complex subunit 2-like isoform X2 n=1 Tax=Metopolophium dirhodum TaxID=44670 RepID=UPI00298FAE50|nr:dynein regulatory complex subunit 2-like isoform X2 [Metopolophium dirhodum]
MAPKKNKKSNKLARMSDEEKLRYLQHRAAIEEETKRRKEQLVATYLKSKLKKEEAFTRLNTAKLNQQWRHNLRQIKCKELKDEMMTMKNRFQILLDCKNDHIDMLLRDLEDAEEQNLKQYGAHAEIVTQFLSIHEKSLEELHARYEHKKQLLLDELKHNFRWMRDIFSRDDERLDLMSVIFEARNDDDTRQTHINFEDSIAVLNNEEEIKMLTQLCAKRGAQYAQRENELKRDREDLIKRGFVAQNQLNVNRNEYKNKLEAMTKVYKNVIDKLTNISKKGERIIKTAENCAKLMNEDDNNLICPDEDNNEGEFDKMSKFWKRYARVDVQCEELDVRRTKAAQENKDLKAALTYYLKTIARPASVQRDIKDGGIQLNLLPVKAG